MVDDAREGLLVQRFESLPANRLDALVSTRAGGYSTGPYAGLNLGLRVEDDDATVIRNRELLFEAYALALERSVWCKQIHADRVRIVGQADIGRGSRSEGDVIVDTDALVTDLIGVPLVVTLADCVPVVLYDPVNHVVGLAHAGWGGTVRRISSRTVAVMGECYGTQPQELIAAIGPSIAPDDYEVGETVITQATHAYGADAGRILRSAPAGRIQFDLWEANAVDLEQAGLARDQIEIAAVSTAAALDTWYSYRVEGVTGRFVTALSLMPRGVARRQLQARAAAPGRVQGAKRSDGRSRLLS